MRIANLVLAEVVFVLHILWLPFIVVGGVVIFRHPGYAWVQFPVSLVALVYTLASRKCALTQLERRLRARAVPEELRRSVVRSRYERAIRPLLGPLGSRWGNRVAPLLWGGSAAIALFILAKHGRL